MNNPMDNTPEQGRPRRPVKPGLQVFGDPNAPLTFGGGDDIGRSNEGARHVMSDYEIACEQIRRENEGLLDRFVALLRSQRLAPSTIRKHRENVEFFINEFLLYEEAKRPADGIAEVAEFLGDWFIRKAMWSTPSAIEKNATSLYKFYTFMAALDLVTTEELVGLKQTIVQRLATWRARCEAYNDPDTEDWREVE